MSLIAERLKHKGIVVPLPATSIANYAATVKLKDLLFVSGQLPFKNGEIQHLGVVGEDLSVESAQKAAELCMLNVFAQVRASVGSLDAIERCVRICGFVTSNKNFREHSKVLNGASDLVLYALSDKGLHTRSAVGCSSLPLGAAVEVEAIFQVAG